MKDNLQKANESLLEGDRDGVLEVLQNEPEIPEVIWLRANSVLLDKERLNLLRQLAEGDSRYVQTAREFLERELKFEKELSEPPDYKFWKQPTWEKRLEKMRAYRMWIVGGIILLILGIFGTIINGRYETEYQQRVAGVQATQTAQAFFSGKQFAQYSEGVLSIIDVEDPVDTVDRPVTFGETLDDKQLKPVLPANGARFVAVLINFQCSLAICNEPPEADLGLLLADGKTTPLFNYSSHPFFIDEPPNPENDRLANGRSIKLWFVFEVPRITSPKALFVVAPNQQEPLIVSWPVR